MGFTVEEVVEGIGRLLARLGAPAEGVRDGEAVRFPAPRGIAIEVRPMPEERIRYPILFPRTLLVLRGEDGPIEELYHQVLLTFLRVGG